MGPQHPPPKEASNMLDPYCAWGDMGSTLSGIPWVVQGPCGLRAQPQLDFPSERKWVVGEKRKWLLTRPFQVHLMGIA